MSLTDKSLWAMGSERRKGWVVESLSGLTIEEERRENWLPWVLSGSDTN